MSRRGAAEIGGACRNCLRPKRVLITRLSAIGDCILTLPLACAVKRAFPDATVEWIVEPPSGSLLQGHDCIDRLHVIPKRWLKAPAQVMRIRRMLRNRRFDCVLDPQGLTRSSLLGWLSGAPLRVCLTRPEAREVAPILATHTARPDSPHVAQRQLALLKPLGVDTLEVEFRLPNYSEAAKRVDSWLHSQSLGRFVVINPGAQWPTKLWLPERFADVARQLERETDMPAVVVWAGDVEREMAQTIVTEAGGRAIVAPATSLTQLAELLRRARLFVSSDTGPLHLAVAAGTPSVGLYGPTRPEVCGPFGRPHRVVQAWYQGGSSRRRKRGANLAMRDITVPMVIAACQQVLVETGDERPLPRVSRQTVRLPR